MVGSKRFVIDDKLYQIGVTGVLLRKFIIECYIPYEWWSISKEVCIKDKSLHQIWVFFWLVSSSDVGIWPFLSLSLSNPR